MTYLWKLAQCPESASGALQRLVLKIDTLLFVYEVSRAVRADNE